MLLTVMTPVELCLLAVCDGAVVIVIRSFTCLLTYVFSYLCYASDAYKQKHSHISK